MRLSLLRIALSLSFPGAARCVQLMIGALLVSLVPRLAAAEARRAVLVWAERGNASESLESSLVGALRGQLRELDVAVLIVRASQEPLATAAHRAKQIAARDHALGVIWLEASDEGLSVFLYDASGHLYVREVEPDGSAASQSEALAIILRSAFAALLEGELVGMHEIALPAPAPAPPPPAAPPTARPPSHREGLAYVRGGVSYVGTVFARRSSWQSGAALVVTVQPTRLPWVFGADYALFPTTELYASGTSVELNRHPGELFSGVTLPISPLRLSVLGALSADYVQRTTTRVGEGWSATPDSGRWLWAISTRLGLTAPLSNRVFGVLTLGADFLLNPFSQVLSTASVGSDPLGSLLRARPRAELGLAVSAW